MRVWCDDSMLLGQACAAYDQSQCNPSGGVSASQAAYLFPFRKVDGMIELW